MRRLGPASALWLAAAAMAAGGCSSVNASSRTYPDAPSFAPTDPSAVEILQSDPAMPYVRLGEVTISLQNNPSRDAIAKAVKEQAAKMGGTAAVLVYDGSQAMGAMYSGPMWAPADPTQLGQVLIAVVIRYR
jgi:ABC-type sugar transport system substrate-binding protein